MNNILFHRNFVKENIAKSFGCCDIEKSFDDELEKGKWNVGDQRFFHGNMHYVAELKPDGSPRWRRVKKNSGDGGSDNATSSTKTSDDSKQNSTNNQFNDKNNANVNNNASSTPKKSDSFKQTDKNSSFVTKTIDEMKKALKWKIIPDENFKKVANAISNDENTAKKILSAKFPVVGVDSKIPYSESSNIIDIGGGSEIECETKKWIEKDTLSALKSLSKIKRSEFTIVLKNKNTGLKKRLSRVTHTHDKGSAIKQSDAMKESVMEALYNYYKEK